MDKNSYSLESVFVLRRSIENVFFKEFLDKYPLKSQLNETGIRTLMILSFNGKCSMKVISKFLSLEKGSFTTVANKLIKAGFVTKEQDQNDKRVYLISLTESGEKVAADFRRDHKRYIESLLEDLSAIEKETFFNAVGIVNGICEKIAAN